MRMSKVIIVFRNDKQANIDIAKNDVKKEFENLKNALVKGKFYCFSNSIIRLDDVINIFYK